MARNAAAPKDDDPTKQGRVAQLRAVFKVTRQVDKALIWYMLLALLGGVVVGALLGFVAFHTTYFKVVFTFAGLVSGVLGAMIVLARRAERAMYTQLDGRAGTVGYALRGLRRGWNVDEQPVAFDPRTQDLVFRAVGRPGIVLVTEGPLPRVQRLVGMERKRLARMFPEVPVIILHGGDGEGQIPLPKLARTIMRKAPAMKKDDVAKVTKLVRSMPAAQLPIPKGVDPTRVRPDRKATRGR